MQRLSEISEVVKTAQDTGRCIFMDGKYGTDNYPALPALASDVAICLFGSGTTGLEGFLAGARVAYLDLEHFYSFPEYKWGKNIIVFDNLDILIELLNKYRYNKGSFDEFGNINRVINIKDKDPFRDGKAAQRMGYYIQWLFEVLRDKKNRDLAIQYVNDKYTKEWGNEKIDKLNKVLKEAEISLSK
jgi:hypothetical protein